MASACPLQPSVKAKSSFQGSTVVVVTWRAPCLTALPLQESLCPMGTLRNENRSAPPPSPRIDPPCCISAVARASSRPLLRQGPVQIPIDKSARDNPVLGPYCAPASSSAVPVVRPINSYIFKKTSTTTNNYSNKTISRTRCTARAVPQRPSCYADSTA